MTDTVIIYSSKTGNTRKVAEYLADKLGADKFDLKQQSNIDLTPYKKIIIGTGVHAGNPYSRVSKFVEDHSEVFLQKQVSLFVSCLFKGERAEKEVQDIAKEYHISNAVYFSTRGEKNSEGISKDADAFIERMKQ